VPLTDIRVEIPAAIADGVEEVLLEAGDDRWSLLEEAIVKRAWLVGVFSDDDEARARWNALLPLLPVKPLSGPVLRALADSDWRDSYKAHFRAWDFGRLHWVPLWERDTYVLPTGHAALWLDPGMAFGTGNHETTRLCCERLAELASGTKQPRRVIDAGCGSGILALSAALLGCASVSGFDLDPEAVRVSHENAELNGLAGHVKFAVADLPGGLAGLHADLVLANIQADVLTRHARALIGAVAPGGSLVLSGILATEGAAVRAAFAAAAPGWKIGSRNLGEWCDLVLKAP